VQSRGGPLFQNRGKVERVARQRLCTNAERILRSRRSGKTREVS
jgi:hypothetical protein